MTVLSATLITTLLLFTSTLTSQVSALLCPSTVSKSSVPAQKPLLFVANYDRKNYHRRCSNQNYKVQHHYISSPTTVLSMTSTAKSTKTTTATKEDEIKAIKSTILSSIKPTQRGLSTTPTQKSTIETQIQQLESLCPLSEPARSPQMDGKWFVEYTTAPPPSNGQLGPFVGSARQVIELDTGRYANVLIVEPKEWLSAVLDATWEEWDGVFLEKVGGFDGDNVTTSIVDDAEDDEVVENEETNDKDSSSPFNSVLKWFRRTSNKSSSSTTTTTNKKPDYGATSWKVSFDTLTIKLFGIPIVTKKFDGATSRVWRMSYLDDDTRIVRAGQTGKSEDDVVFYMTRE